jgi:PhnB protein
MHVRPLLSVRDVEASLAFYTDLLGFTPEGTLLPGADGKPVFAGVKHGASIVWLDHTEYDELPPNTPLGVGVELYIALDDAADIDGLYQRLKAAGVTLLSEVQDQFWGDRRFVLQDPDGYRLSISKNVRQVSNDEMSGHTQANYTTE